MGALALFGEKYGDTVRVIRYGDSIELCGGTHVAATGQIGLFKIVGESAIAAGIRRIEAITAEIAEKFVNEQLNLITGLKQLVKNPNEPLKAVQQLIDQNSELKKVVEKYESEKALMVKEDLLKNAANLNGITFIAARTGLNNDQIKEIVYSLKQSVNDLFIVLANENEGKAGLTILVSDPLVSERKLHAGNIIREIARHIQGGGGGQANFATAGGKNPDGIDAALAQARVIVSNLK
jgi:alanyl-tRNA synthetase